MNAVVSAHKTMQTLITGSEQALWLLRYKLNFYNKGKKRKCNEVFYAFSNQASSRSECIVRAYYLLTNFLKMWVVDWVPENHLSSFMLWIFHLCPFSWQSSVVVTPSVTLPTLLIHRVGWDVIKFADGLVLFMGGFRMWDCHFPSCLS